MKYENIKPQFYIVNCLGIFNCQLSIINCQLLSLTVTATFGKRQAKHYNMR